MNSGNQSQKTNTNPKIQSFLEALRNRRSSQTEADTKNSLEGLQKEKQLEERRKQEFFETQKRKFNEVYSQKKQQEQERIHEIQAQLKELSKSIKNLDKQVENAVETPVKEAGQYQKNFLDHLRQIIELTKKNIESASTWLHIYNQRSAKKSYYWGQVKKQGTKYMLSSERQVATSIG